MNGSVTGSVLVVVVAGVLYLLLRRRGSRGRGEIKPVPQRAMREAPPRAAGGRESGSSHPAYPVAPAKYSGAPPVKPGALGQHAVYEGGTVSRPELDPVAEARKAANAPAPAEPWYPEAPADYAEEDEGRGPAEVQGRE